MLQQYPLDYKKLLASDALSDAQKYEIRKKDQKLKPRLEAAQKKETEEMMSKLKGFGNSILGVSYILTVSWGILILSATQQVILGYQRITSSLCQTAREGIR